MHQKMHQIDIMLHGFVSSLKNMHHIEWKILDAK